MSELKAYEVYPVVGDNRKIVGSALHDDTEISLYRAQVYLKSEADKVIAEQDKDIAELKEQVHDYAQGLYVMQARAEKELRHHKYKRCLAMAEWCKANCMHTVLLIGHKILPHWEWRIKTNYWYKWRKIWFKLSIKFKDGK